MERQGLSGNNSHQQKPSQTIWARTLWWMRWALRFHLPQVPLLCPTPNLCVGQYPLSPQSRWPCWTEFHNQLCSDNPRPNQTDQPRLTMANHITHKSSMRRNSVQEWVKSYHISTVKAHEAIREIMALNRLEQDHDLHPWQIHGEDCCVIMGVRDRACLWMITQILFCPALEAGETSLISNKDCTGKTEVPHRGWKRALLYQLGWSTIESKCWNLKTRGVLMHVFLLNGLVQNMSSVRNSLIAVHFFTCAQHKFKSVTQKYKAP